MHLPPYLSEVAVQMPLTANSTDTGLVKLTPTPGVIVAVSPELLRAIVFCMRLPITSSSGLMIGSVEYARNLPKAVSRRSPSSVRVPS